MIPKELNNNEDMTVERVLEACSKAKLKDGTLTFDSFHSNIPRESTQDFMYKKGLILEDLEKTINGLNKDDYYLGPIDDVNTVRSHKLWIFKKIEYGVRLYIKIKIINKWRCVVVVSFHEDKE